MRFLRSALFALPILALCVATSASAGVVLFDSNLTASAANSAPAGSTGLGPGGPVGGLDGAPFFFTAPFDGLLIMTITDCCVVGDVYQAFVNGVDLGFTAGVPIGGATLSSGVFTVPVAAGLNFYDINDQIMSYIGFNSPYGGGLVTSAFSVAGLEVRGELVPEPGSLFLLGGGLLALAGFARKLVKA